MKAHLWLLSSVLYRFVLFWLFKSIQTFPLSHPLCFDFLVLLNIPSLKIESEAKAVLARELLRLL